jgi:hypothetical protein
VLCDRDQRLRPIFWQRRIFAFTASRRHANITPAALHRGDLDGSRRESAEAAGRKPKFELSDPQDVVAAPAVPAAQTPSMTPS